MLETDKGGGRISDTTGTYQRRLWVAKIDRKSICFSSGAHGLSGLRGEKIGNTIGLV
jgi:hypothetical protein